MNKFNLLNPLSNDTGTKPSVHPGEELLIQRVCCKDRFAFERLYLGYQPRLRQFIYRMTQRTDWIEDILNETMLVVWRKAANFKSQSSVSTWIFGIAYKKCLKALANNNRLPLEQLSNSDLLHGKEPPPDGKVNLEQCRDAIDTALASLSAEHRIVVDLTYRLGYSYPEIAVIVDCPINTVKTRMYYARMQLRKKLAHLYNHQDRCFNVSEVN